MPLMRYLQLDHKTTVSLPSHTQDGLFSLIACVLFIIASECMVALGLGAHPWVRLLTLIIALTVVVYLSNHSGRRIGLLACLITGLYLIYRFSLPGQFLSYTEASIRVLIVFNMASLFCALSIGRLSDRLRRSLSGEALARAEAEDRQRQLEMILQQLPVGVVIIDAADKHISYSNHQAEDLLGVNLRGMIIPNSPAESDQIGFSTPELVHSDWPLHRALDGLETMTDQEIRYRRPDGQTKELSINAAPVFNTAGVPVAAIATIADISLAKELEQRKDEFISIASHELKSPVTSLKIYLQLLAKQANVLSTDEQQALIVKANNQVNKLSHLMGDLLDLSRLQSGKISYTLTPQLLRPVIKEACDSAKDALGRTITVRGQAPRPVRIDAGKIQQVLYNLLNNAAKYSSEEKSILVRLSQDDDQSIIEVVDKGVGIPTEDLQRVFDLFFQSRSSDGRSGLGIGLYVSNEIVRQHGGRIEVESEPGKGSVFRIVLPNQESAS